MTASTGYAHVELKDDSTPRLAGTRISVARIALDHTRAGELPEEIAAHYQGLTLGEVSSALAYYFDHRDEMERRIEEDRRDYEAQRASWEQANAAFLTRVKQPKQQA